MLDDRLKTPRYHRLAEHLRGQVARGELRPGDRVPSVPELREHFEVSRGTVEKAHALLEQEGLIVRRPGQGTYVASASTRASSGLVGIVSHDGFVGPELRRDYFNAALLESFGAVLHRAGKQIVLLSGDSPSGWDKVDAVAIRITTGLEKVTRLLPPGLPGVSLLVTEELAGVGGFSSVRIDDVDAVRQMVEHLVSLGHRRIACLIETTSPLAQARRRGFLAGLREAGIEPDPAWMREPDHSADNAGGYSQWARDNMRQWLESDWYGMGCTALVAQNDIAAVGALQVLHEAGIHVPEQVSVVSFDSTAVCDCVSPRLTALEVPLGQIAARAAELLLRQIGQSPIRRQDIVLPTRLQVRESTAPPLVAGSHLARATTVSKGATFSMANYASLLNLIEGR